MAFVPGDAKLASGSNWLPVGITLVNQSLKTNALKKRAELTVKVAEVKDHPYDGYAICLHSKPEPVKINGVLIPVVVYACFNAKSLAGLGALRPGDTATVVGTLNVAELQPKAPRLFLELTFAELKQPKAK